MAELDSNGNIEQTDGNPVAKTPSAGTIPDFGVPAFSQSTTSALRRSQSVVRGPYDPHNPTLGVLSDIATFKQLKNVGCEWVVNFDNVLHDPTRGTQNARGTYQIFAYCVPNGTYVFGFETIGFDLNTGAPTTSSPQAGNCPNNQDFVDGLFLCTATGVMKISPVSGHAENFAVGILYEGIPLLLPVNTGQTDFPKLPVNNKGVVYPKIDATSLGYPGVIPFPNLAQTAVNGTIHFCDDLGNSVAPGCVARRPAAGALAVAIAPIYPPPNYNSNKNLYTPHHIQPVCWGGNNSEYNGVFLLRSDPNKYHAQYTAWWNPASFSVGTIEPAPMEDNDC